MFTDAIFSKDRIYRYLLVREWDKALPAVMIVGLNPSTADETNDDPTIRRCIGFAKRWGYGKLFMTNLFGFRATHPKDLRAFEKPVGENNDSWMKKISSRVDKIVLAYGNHGRHKNRHEEILRLIEDPYCIKVTKAGFPAHPLYSKYTEHPIPFD